MRLLPSFFLILLGWEMTALPGPVLGQGQAIQPALKEKKEQFQQLGKEKADLHDRISQFESSEQELRIEIEELENLVRVSHSRKRDLQKRIDRQVKLNQQKEQELRSLENRITSGKRRIGLRLRRLYHLSKKRGRAALFQVKRLQSISKDTIYLARLQRSDRSAIAEFESLNENLRIKREELEQTLEHLISLREELEVETKRLFERESYLQASLRDLRKNRSLYREYLDNLEKVMSGMESTIVNLENESARQRSRMVVQYPTTLKGDLPGPVEGTLIARFGEQDPRYDLKKFQRGIVLRVAENAPVIAVAGGKVVHAGQFRGYQSLVVLDHGQSLFTVYGHLERLLIRRGDWVAQGQEIGQAIYQPAEQGYDVYFEIRFKGKPADPLEWMDPGQVNLTH